MAKKEVQTDLWVHDLLREAEIELDAQGSTVKEIDEALKTASKRGTGKVGFPEYVGIVKDFLLVIEDKANLQNHIKRNENSSISLDTKAVTDFAVNGALFYAEHLAKNTSYKKIIAFGISGNEKKHKITPVFVDDRCNVFDNLDDVESFISFNEKNIDEYYLREVLKEDTNSERELKDILSDAAKLHEDLRNYGNLKDEEKPLVVSGILLALRERDKGNFTIESLTGDSEVTDGEKIYSAIVSNLKRANIQPETKKDKILSQFSIIKNSTKLNEVNKSLAETPLKSYTKFLDEKLYKSIKYNSSAEDYLGRFYGEFMSYSGGSGQTLGIILTPKHITQLFCDLLDIKKTDKVFDPCCGTGGFLVAALYNMLLKAETETEKSNIRKNQLFGIELRTDMFTVATTNMILRGDGKSNLHCDDFFNKTPEKHQEEMSATVGLMNPPYSQGSKKNPELYELAFTEYLLDSLVEGGRCAVIVPQSSMTGKTSEEKSIKESILKKHTLEGVIMLQKDTFYGVGVIPCIAVFTSGQPHPKDKICKFINFEDDGFKVAPHIGLLETEAAKDKKQHLLDVWNDRIEAENKFCVKTTITAEDEWLHSFYYFNDEIPSYADFEKTVGDYLSFEFSMIMQGRKYLFEENQRDVKKNFKYELENREWREFFISGSDGIFKIEATSSGIDKNKLNCESGNIPYITRSDILNGMNSFISDRQNAKYEMDCGNSISIGLDTQTVFYQPHAFFTGQNIQILSFDGMDRKKALFITRLLKLQMEKFNWGGNGATLGRLARTKILLPITTTGEVDYDYMEQFINSIEKSKLDEYGEYARRQIAELNDGFEEDFEKIEDKEWKAFKIGKIFGKFQQGKSKGLNHLNENQGDLPYLGATNRNNGVLTFIKGCPDSYIQSGNCIGYIRNGQGSVGYSIYKSEKFVSTSDNTFAYSSWLNRYNGLFTVTVSDMIHGKYSFGYKRNNERLLNDPIMLPTDATGNPDYHFMELLIRKIMLQKYKEYLNYKGIPWVVYGSEEDDCLIAAEP